MTHIAFDASRRRTGYAYVAGRTTHYWVTGIVDVQDGPALAAVLREALYAGVTAAAIEDCYLGPAGNVRALKALQEAQTRISVACEMAGLPVLLVYAQTWQSAFAITGKRPERKLGAQRVALALGAGNLSEDEADAVCLAEYATRAGRQEELELRGPRGGQLRFRKPAGFRKLKKGIVP
jgi:Holliday junction resolvasome RuvABC endonuclease subunit